MVDLVNELTDQTYKHVLYDGAKAVAISDLPESAWVHYTPYQDEDSETIETYYKAVPWLFRAVDLRAQAIAGLPFAIMQGETEYEVSDDYQNKLEFLPEPENLFYLIEAALTLMAKAYLFREVQGGTVTRLRYLHPGSIEPKLDADKGLTGFKRIVANRVIDFDVEDFLWFWRLDPYVELGPGNNAPAQAALAAAGVLFNVDEFAAGFFKRGAIKATLLTVTGPVAQVERERIESWWKRLFTGISNAWQTKVVNADTVAPVAIGEGIKELENTALTQEKREDISTALGIPQTLLFSQAANYATAKEDRLSFYQETVVPEARFIERVLNRQLFEDLGYRFEFRPDSLDVFQQDEKERAEAFAFYVQAKLKPSVVAEMLGLELPPGVEYADLDPEEPEFLPMAPGQAPAPPQQQQAGPTAQLRKAALDEAVEADLRRWQKKALSKGAGVSFTSEFIPPGLMALVAGRLKEAVTDEEIRAAFDVESEPMFIATPDEVKAHESQMVTLVCPVCGYAGAEQYADHGGLCICSNPECGVTFDPAIE